MKSVFQNGYGGPEILGTVSRDMPQSADDQVVIKNHASTVMAADMAFRSGSPYLVRFFQD